MTMRLKQKDKYPNRLVRAVVPASLLASGTANAYLGPGAGLGMIGSLAAIVIVALVVVLGLVIYPIRMLRKRRAGTSRDESDSQPAK